MSNTYFFDFANIKSEQDFYVQFAAQTNTKEYFGKNLDALWDILTGSIPYPAKFYFLNLRDGQMKEFKSIILTFKEAADNADEKDFEIYFNDEKV